MEKKVLLIFVMKFKFKSRTIKVIENIKQITKFKVTEEPCLNSGGGDCDSDTAISLVTRWQGEVPTHLPYQSLPHNREQHTLAGLQLSRRAAQSLP